MFLPEQKPRFRVAIGSQNSIVSMEVSVKGMWVCAHPHPSEKEEWEHVPGG